MTHVVGSTAVTVHETVFVEEVKGSATLVEWREGRPLTEVENVVEVAKQVTGGCGADPAIGTWVRD